MLGEGKTQLKLMPEVVLPDFRIHILVFVCKVARTLFLVLLAHVRWVVFRHL